MGPDGWHLGKSQRSNILERHGRFKRIHTEASKCVSRHSPVSFFMKCRIVSGRLITITDDVQDALNPTGIPF